MENHTMATKKVAKTPAIKVSKAETRGNWAAASFQGTLYETQSDVINYLATLAHADTAKVAVDTFQGTIYTFVIFKQ
jgi:hypothetical protein